MIQIFPVFSHGPVAGFALVDIDGRVIAIVPRGVGQADWARRLADLIDRHGITDVADTPAGLA